MANGKNVTDDGELINDLMSEDPEVKKQQEAQQQQQAQARRDRISNVKDFVDESDSPLAKKIREKFLNPIKDKFLKPILDFLKQHIVPMLGGIISAIAIIVVAIGLISFILNAPGLIRGKIEQAISETVGKLYTWANGENVKLSGDSIDKEKRKELLNYISSDLGLDVIGFGFVPTATYKKDEPGANGNNVTFNGKQIIEDYESHLGAKAILGEDPKTSNPDADLMYYYLMANERAYIKNDNGFLGLGAIFGNTPWKGMLNIEGEGFSVDSEIDRASKTMILKYSNPSIANGLLSYNQFSYSLEGWTGRYGMPVEFSLALHISTMSSGLVKEMITNPDLQTEVHIGLNKLDCDINFKIIDENGKELEIPYLPPTGASDLVQVLKDAEKATDYGTLYGCYERFNHSLSILGLVKTAEYYEEDYSLDETSIAGGTMKGCSKYIDTINALLGQNQFAVKIKGESFEEEYPNTGIGIHIYRENDDEIDYMRGLNVHPNANSDFSQASGAFICEYDSNGNVIETSGKIGSEISIVEDEMENGVATIVGDVYYAVDSDYKGNDGIYYKVYASRADEGNIEYIGGDVKIPKGGVNDPTEAVMEDVGYGEKVYRRVSGLGSHYTVNEAGNITTSDADAQVANMGDLIWLQKITIGNDKIAYINMFREIDNFLGIIYEESAYGGTAYGGKYRPSNNTENYSDGSSRDPNGFSCYTDRFMEICSMVDSKRGATDLENLDLYNTPNYEMYKLLKDLETDKNYLISKAEVHKTTYDTFINRAFKKMGYSNLTIGELAEIVKEFAGSIDEGNGVVKFPQPYIKYVTRHWFKDVIFDISENKVGFTGLPEKNIYTKTREPLEIDYKGENDSKIQVKAILTPKGEDDYYYVQEDNKQPYIIKGNTILQDGKIIGTVAEDMDAEQGTYMIDADDAQVYHLGDGYRATKKIFTQGMYYTFDGSAETSKSIFWQQQLENAEPGEKFAVTVINGNIYHVTPEEAISDNYVIDENIDQIDEKEIEEATGITITGFAKDYVKPLNVLTPSKDEDGRLIRGGGARYLLIIPENFKYISATEQSYGDVKKQVDETINPIWEAMGVKNLRQHVTFDNTTTSGENTAQTGLSILKNCNTIDADYIYRDLKEMLIDLGYYTEAEFDQLDAKLEWFIPRYATKRWPQNNPGDLNFAAVLNPYDEELDKDEEVDATSTGKKEEEVTPDEIGIYSRTDKGFKEGLEVIAPGACKVVKISESPNYITLEFDGVAQPDISALDGYRMSIWGIEVTTTEGSELKAGDEIGKTGKDQIKVFLENDIGRTLSNVSDYMAPPEGDPQPYQFTQDEIILLAYVINHEGSPEYMKAQMQYDIDSDRRYIVSYDDAESAALAYAAGIGYVLTNRALTNYGDYGTTIEKQTTAPRQYDGSFTIDYALAHQNEISSGSMAAALIVATYDCNYIKKPDDPTVTMSRDVIGQSAWLWNGDESKVFWWLDQDRRDGNGVYGKDVMDVYSADGEPHTIEHPYPVKIDDSRGTYDGSSGYLKPAWDGYLTYK